MWNPSTPQTPLINEQTQVQPTLHHVAVNINEISHEKPRSEGSASMELAPTILYRYRWFVLAVFSFVSFGNAAVRYAR